MNIKNQNEPIFFCGKYLNTKKILKSTRNASFKETVANFVELCPTNPDDINLLRKSANGWTDAEYARMIYMSAYSASIGLGNKDLHKFFVLTTQAKNFEELKANQIKGLMEVSLQDRDCVILNYLQVKPDSQDKNKPYFKHIGKSLVSSLRTLYPNFPIILNATKSSAGFYKKLGFKRTCISPIQYTLPAGQDIH